MSFHALSGHEYEVLDNGYKRHDGPVQYTLNTSKIEKDIWGAKFPRDWVFPPYVLELVKAKPKAVELASKEDIVKKLEELGYLDELEEALAD
jgi:hypothetical protein